MRIVITDEAKADLVGIGEYIRPHNPARAASFINELLDRCGALADMPRAFPLVLRYESHGIRRCPYRVFEGLVEVIHVLHGARNYEALLFPDELDPE
ncbi:MAG: type II toxin-antitoxin system RelE/ParE family toxin [Methylobacter sp.]